MVKPQVFVVGSVSRDVTVTVDRFPAPGETLVGESVTYGLGGKGANQAVASALTGTPTAFLGCVGDDDAGHRLLEELRAYGVATDAMSTVPGDSGTAHITVDAHGENTIAIVPAANRSVSPELVRSAGSEGFGGSRVVVAQGEIPVETLEQLARTVSETSARFILNLAPAADVSSECLSSTDVLVVNESEAQAVIRRHSLPDRGRHNLQFAAAFFRHQSPAERGRRSRALRDVIRDKGYDREAIKAMMLGLARGQGTLF
ncbi:PfkB family carbohydrate kinase [Kocuria massiliensis]|uniref:PfkB family carbohydrate kinase n=1 Tax=Kocuria massiliensis TaxID=1926282 RepID=UPI000A1C9FB5|nr:PfkB family carbohydrate kinase [Kocuria massiliensis]